MKDRLDILKDIRKTEAPEFLFTRIMQRVKDKEDVVTPKFAWALGISFLLVLSLNIGVIIKELRSSSPHNMVTSMELITDNSLYHE